MVLGIGDDLTISISADTADFTAGAEGVESQLDDLSGEALQTAAAMAILGNRTDEAGDQIAQTGRRATVTSGQMGALSSVTNLTNASFLGISATTYGALIPAIVALGAALAPVVASLGGFVAIAGSVAGVGLVPVVGAIATETEQLRQEFDRLVNRVMPVFEPVFSRAANVLAALMAELGDMLVTLAPTEEMLTTLGNGFYGLGQTIIDAIPPFVELAVTIADEFLPALIELTDDILADLPGIISNFVDIAERMAPMFAGAANSLMRFLPELTEFGFTVLNVLAPALGRLINIGTRVLRFVNNLSTEIQGLVASGSLLAPVLAVLASTLGGPLTVALSAIMGAVVALRRAFQTNFAQIRTYFTGLSNQVQRIIPPLRQAFMSFVSGLGLSNLEQSIGGLADTIGTQLIANLRALRPVFGDIRQLLVNNQDEFRAFGRAIGNIIGMMIRLSSIIIQVAGPVFRNFLIPVFRETIDLIGFLIDKLGTAARLFNALSEGNFGEALNIGGNILESQQTDVVPQFDPATGGATTQEQEIRLVLDEDTDLVNARIESGARNVVTEQERRVNRNTNTSGSPQ